MVASGPLPPAEAVDAVLQIIAGLEAAQQAGVLHRDIKPSNCFIDPDGTIKIGDFGLSITTTVRTESNLTGAGSLFGTPAFSSPEQLRGEELTVRSDIYSVGVTLYYLLTGRMPFEAANIVQLLVTVLEKRPSSPATLRAGIPKGLARAVLHCLNKDAGAGHFASYAALRLALLPYASFQPIAGNFGLCASSAWPIDTVDFEHSELGGVVHSLRQSQFQCRDQPRVMPARGCSLPSFPFSWWSPISVYSKAFGGLRLAKRSAGCAWLDLDGNTPGVKKGLLRALILLRVCLVTRDGVEPYFSSDWTTRHPGDGRK